MNLDGMLPAQRQRGSLPRVGGSSSVSIRLWEEVKQKMNEKWDIYEDAQGNWRWRRVAANGRIDAVLLKVDQEAPK